MINIAMASDTRFAPGMLVTAGSMALHARPGVKLRFYVLDCGLKERDRSDLVALLEKVNPNADSVFLRPDLSRFLDLPTWRGNHAAYGRLLLHELLPDLDYILYTDVDMFWRVDCAEWWEMRDDAHAIWAASNSIKKNMEGKFFCTGSCLMNLKWMRENDFTRKMAEWVVGRELKFPDMEILNALLEKDAVIVDSIWDMQEAAEWDGAFSKHCVIHYTRNKPWLSACKLPLNVLSIPWWRFWFKFIGVRHSLRVDCLFARGFVKRLFFSSPRRLHLYASIRGLSAGKLSRLKGLFLVDCPRNESLWTVREDGAEDKESI